MVRQEAAAKKKAEKQNKEVKAQPSSISDPDAKEMTTALKVKDANSTESNAKGKTVAKGPSKRSAKVLDGPDSPKPSTRRTRAKKENADPVLT